MKPTIGYLVEESGDELNDETFGNLDDELISKPDFHFANPTGSPLSASPLPSHVSSPLTIIGSSRALGSAAASPSTRKGLTAAELEQQILSQSSMSPARGKVMTVEELEQSFKSQSSLSLSSQQCPMSPPPGFVSQQRLSQAQPLIQITFPKKTEEEEPDEEAPNNFLMTKYEREGIRRIHMAQLTTENPVLEDFYYQAFSKRSLKNQNQSNTPLYLPLPNMKKKQVSKDRMRKYIHIRNSHYSL